MPIRILLSASVAVMLLFSGCATKFKPETYVPASEGHVKITSSKPIVVYPAFDHTAPVERKNDDPGFNAAAYFENMIETELGESGLQFTVASFSAGNDFDTVGAALSSSNLVPENAVVFVSSLATFPNSQVMTCDVKMFDHAGKVLFEKRGISIILSVLYPEAMKHHRDFMYLGKWEYSGTPEEWRMHRLRASQMVMRQIFNDPDFIKALQ